MRHQTGCIECTAAAAHTHTVRNTTTGAPLTQHIPGTLNLVTYIHRGVTAEKAQYPGATTGTSSNTGHHNQL